MVVLTYVQGVTEKKYPSSTTIQHCLRNARVFAAYVFYHIYAHYPHSLQ